MTRTLLQRTGSLATAFVLSISSLLTISLSLGGTASAAGLTCTWTGNGGNMNFSTAGNWSGCNSAAPGANDVIVLPTVASNSLTLTNDLSGNPAFAGLTLGLSATSGYSNYTVDKLNFANNAEITTLRGVNLDITDNFTAAGGLIFKENAPAIYTITKNITVNFTNVTYDNIQPRCAGGSGEFTFTWRPTGAANVINNSYYSMTGTESSVNVASGSMVFLPHSEGTVTYPGNITLDGGAFGEQYCGQAADYALYATAKNTILTGTITLNGNAKYLVPYATKLTLNGSVTGAGHSLTNSSSPYSKGTFINNATSDNSSTPKGEQVQPIVVDPPITDSKPSENVEVTPKKVVTVNGERGDVFVSEGGTLKGSGTVKSVYVGSNAIVAPGNSPGKLTILETLNLNADATYQAELLNKDTYDQLQVSAATRTTGQDVTINASAKLDVVLFDKYVIKKGDTFTIINNLQPASQKINGTFSGLAEGATLSVGSASFSISYEGGDGNDVVLTALTDATAPAAPNTGFAAITTNPIVTLAVTLGVAGFITLIALTQKSNRKAYANAKSVRRK